MLTGEAQTAKDWDWRWARCGDAFVHLGMYRLGFLLLRPATYDIGPHEVDEQHYGFRVGSRNLQFCLPNSLPDILWQLASKKKMLSKLKKIALKRGGQTDQFLPQVEILLNEVKHLSALTEHLASIANSLQGGGVPVAAAVQTTGVLPEEGENVHSLRFFAGEQVIVIRENADDAIPLRVQLSDIRRALTYIAKRRCGDEVVAEAEVCLSNASLGVFAPPGCLMQWN